MDRKGSRDNPTHPSRQRKRKFKGNRYTLENETSFTSTSAEKLLRSDDREITIDNTHAYRILHFFSVFSTISTLVNCKNCNKEITFKEASSRGLGFKIAVTCECGTAYINSCPLINSAYEINRRIVMVMRLLGIGNKGINLFCGLMDLAVEFYSQTYYSCLTNIHQASQTVYKILVKHAVDEEKQKTLEKEDSNVNLTVCGDSTWKKREYSSLYGVTTLAGKYSRKIIDSVVKSSYCKMCEVWEKKAENEEEFEEWKESHQESCTVNHDGSAEKMEVDSVKEMFQRSIAEYGVKYTRYVGDGDSKIFKGILDLNPYDVQVKKLECVLHVKKRMDSRLRDEKTKNKGIGGKGPGELTDKVINDLQTYYGLAITRHVDSVDDMRKAIWSTYYHKCSTDEKPQHTYCPAGEESWCAWRRAEAAGTVKNFTHNPPLSEIVQKVIRPIYEDLSKDDLLERCLGGNTQNNNESYNGLLWHFAPKHLYCGLKTIEIANYLAVGIFNEGYYAVLKVFETMGVLIGPIAKQFSDKRDDKKLRIAERKHLMATRKARTAGRKAQAALNEFYEEEEGVLYGPGIAD